MDLTIQNPDELARDLAAAGGDLSRRALQGFALEEYKRGRLTKPALRQMLGFSTRDQLDGFLKYTRWSKICQHLPISNMSVGTCAALGSDPG
jgi:hypothetical protein